MRATLGSFLAVLLVVQVATPPAFAFEPQTTRPAPQQPAGAAPDKAPQIVEVKVPDGTPVEIQVKAAMSSEVAKPGTILEFTVVQPVKVNGATVIEAGATASGVVRLVKKAGHWARDATLRWAIQDVVAVDGSVIPLRFPAPPPKNPDGRTRGGSDPATAVRESEMIEWVLLTFPLIPVYVGAWALHKGKRTDVPAGERFAVYVRGEAVVKARGPSPAPARPEEAKPPGS